MYLLKVIPEDFVVEELSNRQWQDRGAYLVLEVTKRERNTEDVAQQLAKQTRRQRKDVAYAGLKDRHALTTQYFSIKGAKQNILDWINIDKVTCKVVGFTNEPLSLGSLKGNKFTIVIRNVEQQPKPIILVPNYFDEQRFSKNNDVVGKALVKRDFKRACELIDDERLKEVLQQRPTDYIGALRVIPRKLLTLYVHAYQSRLFNKVLEHQVKEHSLNELRTLHLPIVGFGTDDTELYDALLEQEEITSRDFIIRELPDVSSEGGERQAILEINDLSVGELEDDDLNPTKKKVVVKFSLPKGAYATNIVKWLFSQSE